MHTFRLGLQFISHNVPPMRVNVPNFPHEPGGFKPVNVNLVCQALEQEAV